MKKGIEFKWQCSKCLKVYSKDDFFKLEKKALDPDCGNLSITCVCECGKNFGKDTWHISNTIKNIPNKFLSFIYSDIVILTRHTELNYENFWYETIATSINFGVFKNFRITPMIGRRYKTQDDAMLGHFDIVNKLERNEYILESTNNIKYLVLKDNKGEKGNGRNNNW